MTILIFFYQIYFLSQTLKTINFIYFFYFFYFQIFIYLTFFFLLHPQLLTSTKFRYLSIVEKMDVLKELDTLLIEKLFHRLLRIDQSPNDLEVRISMFMGSLAIAIHTKYILFLDIENFIKTAYELDQANIYLDQMDDYSCFLFDEDTKNKTLLKTREDYVMRKK